MRIQRAKVNQILLNKINGQLYKVVETAEMAVVAKMIDPKTEEVLEDDTIFINEDNDICFRIQYDPNPPEIPYGYTIENGYITRYGYPIVQGEYEFTKILCSVRSYLLLVGRLRSDPEDRYYLISYHIHKDKFQKIFCKDARKLVVLQVLHDSREVLLGWTNTHKESSIIKDMDEVEMFDQTVILHFKNGKTSAECLDFPVDLEEKTFVVEHRNGTRSVFIKSHSFVTDEYIVLDDFIKYGRIDISKNGVQKNGYIVTREDLISATSFPVKNEPFLRSKERMFYAGFTVTDPRLSQFEGYDYLVDFELSDNHMTFTIANSAYQVIHVKVEPTHDRGNVVTIY